MELLGGTAAGVLLSASRVSLLGRGGDEDGERGEESAG